MKNTKLVVCKVTNVFLRQSLVDLCRKNKHKIDENCNDRIDKPIKYSYFWLDDYTDGGAGFGYEPHISYGALTMSIEEMFDFISKPQFEPISIKLNDNYTAEIQENGTVKVGCQTFTSTAIIYLAAKIEEVIKKSI